MVNQNINDILQSIALEEAAISHIINAEGEKIQRALEIDNLAIQDLIDVNRSVSCTIQDITNLEVVLSNKLKIACKCSQTDPTDSGQIVLLLYDCVTKAPLVNAYVRLYNEDKTSIIGTTFTNSNGIAIFSNLADGTYLAEAISPITGDVKTITYVVDKNNNIVFKSQCFDGVAPVNNGFISLRVTKCEDGTSYSNVNVKLYDINNVLIEEKYTDVLGLYEKGFLESKTHKLVITDPITHSSVVQYATLTPTNNFVILTQCFSTPIRNGTINLTVTTCETSTPLALAKVEVLQGTTVVATGTTGANGSYSKELPYGSYVLRVTHSSTTEVKLVPATINSTSPVFFGQTCLSNPIGVITLTVLDCATRKPIPNAIVKLYEGATLVDGGVTDAVGKYVKYIKYGAYNAVVTDTTTGASKAVANIILNASKPAFAEILCLSAPLGEMCFSVTNCDGGASISNAIIKLYRDNVLLSTGYTDVYGKYCTQGTYGSYLAIVTNPTTLLSKMVNFNINASSPSFNGDVCFSSCTPLLVNVSGVVTCKCGKGIPNATVTLHGSSMTTATTNWCGQYTLKQVPVCGTFNIFATSCGTSSAIRTVHADRTNYSIDLLINI